MKKNRSRLIKLGVLLISLLLIFFLKNQFIKSPQKTISIFSSVKKEEILEISLTNSNGKTTTVYKKQNRWYLKKDGQEFRADEERINGLIDTFLSLKKDEIISGNKNRHQDLGINLQKISFKTKDKLYVVYVGNTAGLSKNYVRIDNENEVFGTAGLDNVFSPEDYRDLKVNFIANEQAVDNIFLEFEGKTITLEKRNNDWFISGKTAKKERVDFFLNDLKTLKASEIFIKNTVEKPLVYPQLIIKIEENNPPAGGEKTAEFYEKDQNNYYLKTSDSEFIFQIPAVYVSSFKKEEKDFLE